MNSLLQLIIVLCVIALVFWLVVYYLPLPQPFRTIITVLVVLATCVYLLNFVGVLHLA